MEDDHDYDYHDEEMDDWEPSEPYYDMDSPFDPYDQSGPWTGQPWYDNSVPPSATQSSATVQHESDNQMNQESDDKENQEQDVNYELLQRHIEELDDQVGPSVNDKWSDYINSLWDKTVKPKSDKLQELFKRNPIPKNFQKVR